VVPRELLFAVIISLAIFVAALWPSQYPYSQAPDVNPQEQTENGVGSDQSARETPPPPTAREQQAKHRRDGASEFTFLGIKPGEWLLGIVTWMLWWATVRLVAEGKSASEKAIAETRRIGEAQVRAYVDINSSELFFVALGVLGIQGHPMIRIIATNTGQSPARNFVWNPTVQYTNAGIRNAPRSLTRELGSNWRNILGVGIAVGQSHPDAAMIPEMELLKFLREGDGDKGMVLVRIHVHFEFEDVFEQRNTGEAYFAGMFKRVEGQTFPTPWGETQWSGKLSRIHRPSDWPENKDRK
jgi:hypothetical protein